MPDDLTFPVPEEFNRHDQEISNDSQRHHDLARNVLVSYGVVDYWGVIDSEDERDAARVAAENVPGVRGVEDHRVTTYAVPSMT